MSPVAGEWFLYCMAACALAFAGFTGLIFSIRQRTDKWSLWEVSGLKFILGHCFGAVLLSFAPFIPAAFLLDTRIIWGVSHSLLAAFLAGEVFLQVRRIMGGNRAGSGPRFPRLILWVYIVPTSLLSLASVWTVHYGVVGIYLFGLLWLLIQSGIQFSLLLHGYITANTVTQPQANTLRNRERRLWTSTARKVVLYV